MLDFVRLFVLVHTQNLLLDLPLVLLALQVSPTVLQDLLLEEWLRPPLWLVLLVLLRLLLLLDLLPVLLHRLLPMAIARITPL